MRTTALLHSTKPALLHTGGFTLVELMVSVAVLSVLLAVALPSLADMIDRWRVRQVAEDLRASLYFARSEAIKRGGHVALQKIPNHSNGCTSASGATDWDCGWIVCHDLNNNGKCTSNEPVLQRVASSNAVQISRTGGADSIKLNRWGLVDGPWLGFNLVPLNKPISHPSAHGLCVSSGGRIRILSSENLPCTG